MLTEYLDEKRIVLDLDAKDLRQALVQMLARRDARESGALLDDIMAREALMSTLLGKGVAIPRAVLAGKRATEVIIGMSKKGIDMRSFDRVPVRIVMLHLFAAADNYAAILAQSLRLLNDESLRNELLACTNRRDVIETIKQWEEE